MKQFWKILKFELKNYFSKKVFIIVTLLLVAVIAAVMFIPRITSLFESDGNADSADAESSAASDVMLVKADAGENAEVIKEYFEAEFPEYKVELTDDDLDGIKAKITDGDAECAFVLTSPTEYTYYVDNLSMYDQNTAVADEALQSIYRINAMTASGMTPEQANEVMNIQITGKTESLGKNQMQNFYYTYIMIFALYFVILLYGQMVTSSVATEKSSRAMELLITSAKPVAMMFGKVISSCIAGLTQLAVVFGSAILFYNINKSYWSQNILIGSIFNIPSGLLVFMLVFFILGFLIYAFLYGAVGSTVSKLEDVNSAVMPLTYMFIFAFIVVMFSMGSGEVDNILMKVCSYIPFTSPMAMFTRIAMSRVPWYEIAASILILTVSTIGIGVLSAKIYRVGVLLYGTPPKFKTILKLIKKS